MKRLMFLCIFFLAVTSVFAQRSNEKWFLNSFGVRAEVGADSDNMMGFEFNHFLQSRFAMTGLYISNWDFSSSCLCEGAIMAKYVAEYPNLSSRLRWYVGGGLEFFGQSLRDYDGTTKTGESRLLFGPTAVLGSGYSFKKVPINLTVEWRPTIYAIHHNRSDVDVPEKFAIFAFTMSFITGNKL